MDDYRQHLENCLHIEQDSQNSDVEQFSGLLESFRDDMEEVITHSSKTKFGFVEKARAILNGSRSQVIENRERMNEELQRSVIRITGAIVVLFLLGMGLARVKGAIDNQFCEFYNVQGRTARYETQKPCER
ncbi:MAG: hypothetical protein HC836_36955 [Richelia sp. RM2_1_2]|nr:hypothetical protein [Richelia sp. RM2_1_2]